ncbi:hypothetical protein MaudCBS49596_000609 [Microsporum audouinii]
MAPRNIALIAFRNAATQRAHFAIFIPSATDQDTGTLIHVVGAPMAGYQLTVKRNYSIVSTNQQYIRHEIGQIDSRYIVDAGDDLVEIAASQIRPPIGNQRKLSSSC